MLHAIRQFRAILLAIEMLTALNAIGQVSTQPTEYQATIGYGIQNIQDTIVGSKCGTPFNVPTNSSAFLGAKTLISASTSFWSSSSVPKLNLIKVGTQWIPGTVTASGSTTLGTDATSLGEGNSTYESTLSAAGIATTIESGSFQIGTESGTVTSTETIDLNTGQYTWVRTINESYNPGDCLISQVETLNRTATLPITLSPINATLSIVIVNPPANFSYTLSADTYRATQPIQFIAQSPDAATPISWIFGLSYTTSGGVGPFQASSLSFTTTSGLAHNGSLHDVGGQAVISATQYGTTATETGTITGESIPPSVITARLTSLYAPTNVSGYTSQLLCQIAMQESTYMQFKKSTLYGVNALWPNENFKTSKVAAGKYIGLLQVPTTMATAFDWYANTQKGANIFKEKIAAVVRYQNRQMARVKNLPAMSGRQIEDSALSLYGGFVDQNSTRKNKPALRYYVPGSVDDVPTWMMNPADDDISSQGNSATDYVNGVRKQTLPQ